GSDGATFVTDFAAGRVFKYGAQGGDPLAAWGNGAASYHNPTGVVADRDGTVYVATLGSGRLYQTDNAGTLERSYDLRCQPWFLADSGDWLDVSCDAGIVSLDKRSGKVRRGIVDGGNPPLANPTGLTYGAN